MKIKCAHCNGRGGFNLFWMASLGWMPKDDCDKCKGRGWILLEDIMTNIELAVKIAIGKDDKHTVVVRVQDGLIHFKIMRSDDNYLIEATHTTVDVWQDLIELYLGN